MFDAEALGDTVIAHLRADLPTRIATVNALHDDFEISAPPDDGDDGYGRISCCYSNGSQMMLDYPWVEVAVPDFAIDNFSLGQVYADVAANVVITGWYHDPIDAKQLASAIYRFQQALLDSMAQPGAFGTGEVIGRLRGAVRTNPELEQREEVLGLVTLVFTVPALFTRS